MLAAAQTLSDRFANRIARARLNITMAQPEDLEELGRFRYRVYVEQTGKDAVHVDHIKRSLLEPLDAVSVNLIARRNDHAIIGAARISRSSDGWQLPDQCRSNPWPWVPPHQIACVSRLMVDRESSPVMTMPALFSACFNWGMSNDIRLCAIFCGENLLQIFRSYGCQQFDEIYIDRFVGAQIPMISCLRDREHFISIGSPFLNLIGSQIPDHEDIAYMRMLSRQPMNRAIRQPKVSMGVHCDG